MKGADEEVRGWVAVSMLTYSCYVGKGPDSQFSNGFGKVGRLDMSWWSDHLQSRKGHRLNKGEWGVLQYTDKQAE